MPIATVTYFAPERDSNVVEIFGYGFFDSEPKRVEVSEHALAKLKANRFFEVVEDDGETILPPAPKKRGRPPAPKAEQVTIENDEGGE